MSRSARWPWARILTPASTSTRWDGVADDGDLAPAGQYALKVVLGEQGREILPPGRIEVGEDQYLCTGGSRRRDRVQDPGAGHLRDQPGAHRDRRGLRLMLWIGTVACAALAAGGVGRPRSPPALRAARRGAGARADPRDRGQLGLRPRRRPSRPPGARRARRPARPRRDRRRGAGRPRPARPARSGARRHAAVPDPGRSGRGKLEPAPAPLRGDRGRRRRRADRQPARRGDRGRRQRDVARHRPAALDRTRARPRALPLRAAVGDSPTR